MAQPKIRLKKAMIKNGEGDDYMSCPPVKCPGTDCDKCLRDWYQKQANKQLARILEGRVLIIPAQAAWILQECCDATCEECGTPLCRGKELRELLAPIAARQKVKPQPGSASSGREFYQEISRPHDSGMATGGA